MSSENKLEFTIQKSYENYSWGDIKQIYDITNEGKVDYYYMTKFGKRTIEEQLSKSDITTLNNLVYKFLDDYNSDKLKQKTENNTVTDIGRTKYVLILRDKIINFKEEDFKIIYYTNSSATNLYKFVDKIVSNISEKLEIQEVKVL